MKCTVLGAGSWGTALAIQLAREGHETVIWDRNPDRCDAMNTDHRNPRYLREVALPESLRAEASLIDAVAGCDLLVPVVPSHGLRAVMEAALPAIGSEMVLCCATKGIEDETLQTMHEVLVDVVRAPERTTLIYGPSFALELGRSLPTAVVVAGPDDASHFSASAFHGGALRCYHTEDVMGVCVGGSLKNVMAIACGVADGVGLGDNARAALITRGLAEITRLAVAMGAHPLTMMGLAGMGDLVLTCTGNLSRNRRVGLGLGKGQSLDAILLELGEVAEGVTTASSAWKLSKRLAVEMPITDQIHAMLYEDVPVHVALRKLMGRDRRAERD